MNFTTAFIFPGQGAQIVGMGKEFYDNFTIAKEIFDQIDDALGYRLSQITFNGPDHELTLTHNTQPAIMSVSIAIFNVLQSHLNLKTPLLCDVMAGHSLGEYSALCAAGSIGIAETAKLLHIRGTSMQQASTQAGEGAMAACLGINIVQLEKIINQNNNANEICDIANDNIEGQVVISGHIDYVDRVVQDVKDAGYKAVKLKVSAPFHSRIIKSAEYAMSAPLDKIEFRKPSVPIIHNITAQINYNAEEIRNNLLKQVCGRVRWRETIALLHKLGVKEIVEIGPRKVLTGMLKKTDFAFNLFNISTIDEMKAFITHRRQ